MEESELLPVTWGLIGPLIPYQICLHFIASELTESSHSIIVLNRTAEIRDIVDLLKVISSFIVGFRCPILGVSGREYEIAHFPNVIQAD